MKFKKLISFTLSLGIIISTIPGAVTVNAVVSDLGLTNVAAQDLPQIKNIIYMIPDGGGFALYDFANGVKEEGGLKKVNILIQQRLLQVL